VTSRWNRIIYAAFSVLVTGAVFGYLLTEVSIQEIALRLRRVDFRGMLMFVTLSFAMSVFRTWRYAILLRTSGYAPGNVPLFLVVLVRNFFSDLLPARIGTAVYVYIVTGRLRVPFGASASSFAVAFLFDMVALAPMIFFAALLVGPGTHLSLPALLGGGVLLVVVSVVVLAVLPRLVHQVGRLVPYLRMFSDERLAGWQGAVFDAEREIERTKKAGIYARLLLLSFFVRVTKYGALYVFLYALLFPLGYGIADLSVPRVFIGLCAAEFAASLPVSGIAGFGAYEGAWALVFRLLGFEPHIADLTAVTHHLFTQVYGYSLGALALLVLLLPAFRAWEPAAKKRFFPESSVAFYARVSALVVLIASVLMGIYRLPFVATP